MKNKRRMSRILYWVSFGLIPFLVSTRFSFAASSSPERTYYYGPELTTLEGRLAVETFPGPPEYSSIKTGDRPQSYWVLKLDSPVSVLPRDGNDLEGLHPQEENVRSVQLSMDFDKITPKKLGFSKKGRFRVIGTLFHRVTIHHISRILMAVQSASLLR